MKRLMAVLLTLCLLTGCSGSSPEKTVRTFLDRLAKGDISAAEKLTVDGEMNLDKKAATLYKPLFRSIQYSIGGSTVEGDEAGVSVTVSVIDLETLTSEATSEVMRHILSGGKDGDDYFYNLLLEKLEATDAGTVTLSATAKLVRVEGKWRIQLGASGGFSDAIAGGMGQIIGY